jgi:maltooligosyltrehalose trehalohydrolase
MIDYQPPRPPSIGPTLLPDGSWNFVVWAPLRKSVDLHLLTPQECFLPMTRDDLGYFSVVVSSQQARSGAKYKYRLDGDTERPDPASRRQPDGVHGASELVELSDFCWTDNDWKGVPLEDTVLYELHVGTFTTEGTFTAIIPQLDRLANLGVTAIELMPIAQFSGERNWGYDGVFPFAAQNSYGELRELQKLVDAAHTRGFSVTLDVVYNHLGPEGNYFSEYGPYFTDQYHTPWGAALNFDGADSDEVRFYFIQSALYWLEAFHIDALRLDAIHGIYDASAQPFLAELSLAVRALSARLHRKIYLIAESDENDAGTTSPVENRGIGMDSQWSDDFHHSLHTLLTGEMSGYYADFGSIHHLARTLKDGWYYSGQYSKARRRRHGNIAPSATPTHFVVCSQNHDQVGNRAFGERLSTLVDFESAKLAAGVTLLSPFVPMLFMGEEYGETAPFLYFTDHGDPQLAEAVRRGRQAEFAHFRWKGDIPDPQAQSSFTKSMLDVGMSEREPHRTLLRLYRYLLNFRRERRLSRSGPASITEFESQEAVLTLWTAGTILIATLFHFGDAPTTLPLRLPTGTWEVKLNSAAPEWLGPASCPAVLNANGPVTVNVARRSFLLLECSTMLAE